VRGILKEVNHNAKRYRTVLDQNGVQTKTLVGKHDERKYKDALLIPSKHDGIYLQSGRNKYVNSCQS
jgi:hypothetical protein